MRGLPPLPLRCLTEDFVIYEHLYGSQQALRFPR